MADKISGNVVHIQNYAGLSKKSGPSNSTRMLQDCRNTVLERSADALARAMDNVDDTLFALADKASNNTLQSHYFDAMREIRIIRKDIESSFKESYKEQSDEIIEKKFSPQIPGKSPSLTEIGLSLVEDDDLEETLAINTLIEKISSVCHNEIYGLDKRIGLLLGKKELETEDNPIGPKTICNAFNTACSRIESGVDIKLIVFKLIDRYICEAIQHVYRDINNHLAMSGILPKIPTQIGKGNAAQGAIMNGVVVGQGGGGGETDFLSAFSQLFTTGGTSGGGAAYPGGTVQGVSGISGLGSQGMPGMHHSGVPGVPGIVGGGGMVTGMPSTMQSLTLMQKGQWDALGIDASGFDTTAIADGTANVLWSIKNSPLSMDSENGDQMIIEIVALLFDYIFENKKVPDKAKALIGRLQIPVLKAAMLDKSFFSVRNHPARRLLNTLAQSTIGLQNDADEDSSLYKGITACVQKILDEFDTDIGIFETALEELEAQLENQQSHFDENVEEAKKLIQGRERLMIAESMAIDEIERRLEDKPFPQFVRNFAMECWKDLLIVIYMKEGQESDAWKSKLEMLDLLIWSTLPKPTLKDRKKLVDMLPTLLNGIEEGMRTMSLEPSEQSQFMEKLSNCHARLVNPETQVSEIKDEKEQATIMKDNVHTLPIASQQTKETETPPAERGAAIDTSKKQPHNIGSIMVEEIKMLGEENTPNMDNDQHDSSEQLGVKLNLFGEDITTDIENVEAEVTAEQPQETEVIEDECTELVRSMVPGIWFEFRQEDGTSSMERLAWISSVLGSYLFTNHDGLKTRELSTHELEESLRAGRAILADDLSFLVDSSFNTLLDDMQKKLA